MKLCVCSLPSPAENLACDEALLDLCEAGGGDPVLRIWESHQYFIALGYANSASTEVNLQSCEQENIPILRRCTGGGTVLQGPGVLNYSIVLQIPEAGQLSTIKGANDFVLGRNREALAGEIPDSISIRGQSDLTVRGLKFSGNAQRRKKHFLLYHGSILLNLNFALLEKVLPMPSREPDYRQSRSHSAFLVNLHIQQNAVQTALARAWSADSPLPSLPTQDIQKLVNEKYSRAEWNLKF